MPKKKWYVVTVGKDIGIFETWLEAGPLVKGVSDALYQSFPTEEQARRIFAQEMSRGNTRIVSDGKVSSPRQSMTRSSTFLNGGNASPSMSSMVLHNYQHLPQNNSQHSSRITPANLSHPSSPASTPLRVNARSPISRTSSEPSSRFHRYEIIDALFKEEPNGVGVEARASINYAQASTPTTNPTSLNSPRMETRSDTSRGVIVKTPTWLTSYPQRKARQSESLPLSPLNSADVPLNTFVPDHCSDSPVVTQAASRVIVAPTELSPVRLRKSTDEESVGDSSIYLSPSPLPHRPSETTYQYDVDPRSPIMNKTQVPELAFVSSLSFSRPSPMVKTERLPASLEPNHIFQSSLLFQSSPISSPRRPTEEDIGHSP